MLCRNFTIRNFERDLPESIVLFWDCHWFKGKDSWLPMKVEIQALNGKYAEYRKFQFQLPNIRNIGMYQLLLHTQNQHFFNHGNEFLVDIINSNT